MSEASTEAAEMLSRARTTLILDAPFFGALAFRLKPQESTRTKTMATDGESLFYNAEFVVEQSVTDLVGELAHEVMHCAMAHHVRREGRDPERWNEAADYAINPVLLESGFTLPEWVKNDPAYKGLSAEAIFSRMPQPQPRPEDEGDGQKPGNGQGQKPGDKPGKDPADIPGAVFDAPDPAEGEAEWRVAVQQAAKTATAMGSMPGALKGLVEEITKPKIDWRPIMRRFFQQSAAADYSWSMPNRRYVSQGIYLPELRSDEMPPVIVYLDTSGSTQPFMAAFIAELQSVVDECQPERVYLVHTDTQVQAVEIFERGERIESVTPAGLGGTDFRPAFQWAEDEQLQPACAVWLTDGEGRYPEFPPQYPVLWCLSQEYKTPWGENVVIQ